MTELKKLKGEEYVKKVSRNIRGGVPKLVRPLYNLKITEESQETGLKVTFSLVAKVWGLPILYSLFSILFLGYFIGIGFIEETYLGLLYEFKETMSRAKNPVSEECFFNKAK